jgi:hypothetical protein
VEFYDSSQQSIERDRAFEGVAASSLLNDRRKSDRTVEQQPQRCTATGY